MVAARARLLLRGRPNEDAAVAYRVTTLGLVLVSVTAAVLQQAVGAGAGVAALALIPIGYLFSFQRRRGRNVGVKIVLAALLFLIFGLFIQSVRFAQSVDDTRVPLVALFLWVQVLHSFDLPRPRDLTFSVASSVVLIALAGSLSFSSGFLILVVVYTPLLIAALIYGHESELRADAKSAIGRELPSTTSVDVRRDTPRTFARPAAALFALIIVCTGVVFVFLPRLPGTNVATLPFSFTHRTSIPGFAGGVVQPRRGGGGGAGSATGFDPHAYFGFGSGMDLRVRGRLSDELVMRVRSPRPALYRAQAYDVYRNGRWTSSERHLAELRTGGLPSIEVPRVAGESSGSELVQTFYVERDLPNVVFSAYRPREVFVPSTSLRVDSSSSLRMPFLLEKDTVYSVISDVPSEPAPGYFAFARQTPDASLSRYLALPASLDGRFRVLANSLTAPYATPVEKAHAVERWIHQNKRYRLDIPRDPPGRDPVDVFVFDRDEGFCEQIASTMALMLRASGVPTRLVTGFGPGSRNVFTGYWEVRNSDSHAWVEVYYPGVGWVSYDPTFGVPDADVVNTTFMIKPIISFFSRVTFLRVAFAAAGRVALPVTVALLVAAAVVFALGRRRKPTATDRVVRAWIAVEKSLRRRGYTRAPHETATEFARRVGDPSIERLASEFDVLRYGRAPSEEDVSRFEQTASLNR